MNETTPAKLEQRTRQIADRLMEATPGLTRQEAKRRARPHARVQLATEAASKAARELAHAWSKGHVSWPMSLWQETPASLASRQRLSCGPQPECSLPSRRLAKGDERQHGTSTDPWKP